MEMLSMGPGRRNDDALLQITDDSDAEPVDLGVRNRPDTGEAGSMDLGKRDDDANASVAQPAVLHSDHWLAGLLRTDVLGTSGAALLLLLAIGLPAVSVLQNFGLYGGPVEAGLGWSFAPSFVFAAAAAGLGLGGSRQAARYGAASWARVVSGVAAVVGALVALGVAVAWFAAAQGDLVSQVP